MRTKMNHLLATIFFLLCVPLALHAQTYYVDGTNGNDTNDGISWINAFRTIQAAIDSSQEGDEIWVKQGDYILSSTIIVDMSIELYGGFPSGKAIPAWTDRDVSGNKTAVNGGGTLRCFNVGASEGISVTIDGFTITGGNAADGYGGAIYNNRDSEILIRRCLFIDNTADTAGGAIFNDSGSRCLAFNSIFAGNTASGHNANGGAIFNDKVDNFVIMNCTFFSNNAPGGEGGAIYNDSVSWALSTITNSIFRGNSATSYPDLANQGTTSPLETITFCNIEQAGYDGVYNNISADPNFIGVTDTNPLNWDLHLGTASPSVDTGTEFDAPGIDFDGRTRPLGYGYDMGAYEYQPAPNTDISVDPSSIDFDDVLVGESASENVTITNNWDDRDLFIFLISVSDGTNFSVNSSGGFTVESEESASIAVRFSPTTVGDFQSVLIIVSDDPDDPEVAVDLSGRGIEPTYHELTWSVKGQGSVTLDPPGGSYLEGTSVEVTAEPSQGWEFDRWSGDIRGSANPETIVMDRDRSITANFTEIPPPEYDLTINVIGQGSVSAHPSDGPYEEGTVVSLTAKPDDGYQLFSWSGTDDDTSIALTNTVTMNSDKTITATFEMIPPEKFTLNVTTTGSGSVSLDPPGGTYDEDTLVRVTAIPDSGWEFDRWSGDIRGSANPETIVMDRDRSITANFTEIPPPEYDLTINVIGQGSVSANPSDGPYEEGTVVSLTADPDENYHFVSWSGTDDDTSIALTNTVTMDSDKIVIATFEMIPPEQFTLNVKITGSGSVSLDPPGGTYDEDTVVFLIALPDDGHQLIRWNGTDDDTSIALTNTVTMNSDKTVTATFEPIRDFDGDLDGIPDEEEKGPNGTNNNYDGNHDSIPDAEQANVASYHTYDKKYYLTIASPAGTFITNAHNSEPPPGAPQDYSFPFGLIGFHVSDISSAGQTTVQIYLPDGHSCDTYYKYSQDNNSWEEFLYDGLTGAEITANVITLHLVDGIRGDQDRIPDGTIIDPGIPAVVNTPIAEEEDKEPDNVCFVKTAYMSYRPIQSMSILFLILAVVFMSHAQATSPTRFIKSQ